jgi:uncharacterized protein
MKIIINIESDHHTVESAVSQEADLKVINLAERYDLAVTQDWELTAVLLGKRIRSLAETGG